jgi:outer membrane protein OmpA-like peptidoglycan-associated protein
MYVRTHEGSGRGVIPYTRGLWSSYIGESEASPTAACPDYVPGEVEKSRSQQGHLLADVIPHPRGLLIADFGVASPNIKDSTKKEKRLQVWLDAAKSDLYSIILRIYGYSDCVDATKNNPALRLARAQRVYALLDKDLQSRVAFVGPARPGEYVADNKTKEGRAKNRGVIIELSRFEEIIKIQGKAPRIPCTGPGCKPPPPPRPPIPCSGPGCQPPPPPPKPPEPPDIDPYWRPPRIPLPNLSPKEILDRAKEVVEYLKRNGGDQSLIKKLESLLWQAGPIVSLAGAVFGLYVFAKGKLVQVAVATGMGLLPRILHRFETSGMKETLERILSELTDPKTTGPIEQEIRRTQPRGPKGKFQKKEPEDEPPGSRHQMEVCRRVRQRYPFYAEEVKIKRYGPRGSLPGQPPAPGLILSDPPARVDCIGATSRTSGLVLFEAKESGPPNFLNLGLTASQRIVYPALLKFGGELVVSKGPFTAGTRLPKGTQVRIITPANLDDI